VFYQGNLFADAWAAMAQPLRVRSYRMYCDARKLAAAPALSVLEFRRRERRLRAEYADVLACPAAAPHVDLVEKALRETCDGLRARALRRKRTD